MVALLAGMFAIGAVPFIIMTVLVSCVLVALVENEKGFWAGTTIVAFLAGLAFFGGLNVLLLAKAHPVWATIGVVGYFAAGAAWSIFKWRNFVSDWRHKYNSRKISFLKSNGIRDASGDMAIPENLKTAWLQNSRYTHGGSRGEPIEYGEPQPWAVPPDHGENKSLITSWIVYWPWSAVWFVLNDPIRRAARAIYRRLQGVYQAVTNSHARGVEADLMVPVPPAAPPTSAGSDGDDSTPNGSAGGRPRRGRGVEIG